MKHKRNHYRPFPLNTAVIALSGHVILEGDCGCGWHGYVDANGWRDRAVPLRDQLAADRLRYFNHILLHGREHPVVYCVEGLLNYLIAV